MFIFKNFVNTTMQCNNYDFEMIVSIFFILCTPLQKLDLLENQNFDIVQFINCLIYIYHA